MSKANKQPEQQGVSMKVYVVVGIICAVAIAAMLVFNSGLLQRTMTAATVNGTKYTAADMQYYYNTMLNQEYQNSQMYAMYGMSYGFDYTKDPAEQVYDEETGKTWKDYMVESAMEYVSGLTALYDKAKAEGVVLTEENRSTIDKTLDSLNIAWINNNYPNLNSYIRALYGPYMTYDRFVELLEREMLVSQYASDAYSALKFTEEDHRAYYEEHKDELDTFIVTQFVLQAKVETPVAAEGEEAVELTDEEKAEKLAQAKAEKSAVAAEIEQKLREGADPAELAEEYADDLFSHVISDDRSASSIKASAYAEWALDAARQNGDITVAEFDSSATAYNYYVVRYEGRYLDETKTADIRHMLIAAETDEGTTTPTEEQYAAAKEKAELIHSEWLAAGGTEEDFAALAAENSADPGSAANGGLMEGVSKDSGYIQEFTDWSLDPARKPGDSGLVQNTGSSTKGWHIMYYVADGMPVWESTVDSTLVSEAYAEWEEAAKEGYTATEDSGMMFVG